MDIEKLKAFNYYNTDFFSLNGISTFCRIVNVSDGDTLTVVFPIYNNFYKFVIRLYGIDTCEIKSKDSNIHQKGIDAKNYVISLLCKANNLDQFDINSCTKKEIKEFFNINFIKAFISCKDFDKFGRILADVYLYNENIKENINYNGEMSLSTILLEKKLAYPYFGETKKSDNELKQFFELD